MNAWACLGWTGNACFFLRFLVQWLASERARKSVAPPAFWWMSLLGTAALGVFAAHESAWLLLAGYAINSAIYARNLALDHSGAPLSSVRATVIALLALAAVTTASLIDLRDSDAVPGWVLVGGIGQCIWSGRFIVQWWSSERRRESHFPAAFWWMSLAGGLLLLAYTLHLGQPIFWLGFVLNPIVQVRNLMLGRERARAASA